MRVTVFVTQPPTEKYLKAGTRKLKEGTLNLSKGLSLRPLTLTGNCCCGLKFKVVFSFLIALPPFTKEKCIWLIRQAREGGNLLYHYTPVLLYTQSKGIEMVRNVLSTEVM